jgi:UDP-N-acetylmuramate dehydrogenase
LRSGEPLADVPLAPLTTLGVGGAARWFTHASSVDEVKRGQRWAVDRSVPLLVLGGGSNLVVADGGFPGLVMQMTIAGCEVRESGDEAVIEAGAGEPWDRVVERATDRGFAGLEGLSGIPGSVGRTPIQNVGAYGQEVADTILRVTALDTQTGEVGEIAAADCGFSYRQSRFKQEDAGRFIVCGVAFGLRRGDPTITYPDVRSWMERRHVSHPTVSDVRAAVLEIRRSKGMVLDAADPDTRSVGSFFMNPIVPANRQLELASPGFPMGDGRVKVPAAWLIERAGFEKGYTLGLVGLSSKHPLAIVNRGGATAAAVIDLACRIKQAVLDHFEVALRPEPVFVGFGEDDRVQFLRENA